MYTFDDYDKVTVNSSEEKKDRNNELKNQDRNKKRNTKENICENTQISSFPIYKERKNKNKKGIY